MAWVLVRLVVRARARASAGPSSVSVGSVCGVAVLLVDGLWLSLRGVD